LGYTGYKFIKEFWIEYEGPATVTWTITSDTGSYTLTTPAHATRSSTRYLIPVQFGAGLNKSKLYRFSWVSASGVQVYPDCCGIRWYPCDADQAQSYVDMKLSEFMQLAL
jgi:hypothetical protein